ncbi:tight junction protein ZO-1-like isoform X4 [Macrobrachium nipponense]|uniref:tight junction protein ZO-1-like isoform X4 n=1 Tax=Macrobrachium nipponense TaxID=159736 RepID=UPI0030C7DF31
MDSTDRRQTPEPLVPTTPKDDDNVTNAKDEVASLAERLSLHSIPSIDRSDGTASPDTSTNIPNLAHTPPNSPKTPILAHTPPPAPPTKPPSVRNHSPRPKSNPPSKHSGDSQSSSQSPDDPPSPGPTNQLSCPDDSPESDDPPPPAPPPSNAEAAMYAAYRSSPPSVSGIYSGIGGLYSGSHPSSGIYSGSASLGSIYGSTEPPPVPPPPIEESGAVGGIHHRREHSLNSIHSIHSINSFKEFYDKSTLNQFISTSPKLSNREMEMNRMSGLYGSIASTGDYSGLTEMFTDPVEEEGGDRVVWEFHNVTLNRVPGYGFGIAVSGGRDNPHFTNGDPSIAISDVLKAGPAEGKLQINDRLISANSISLENVDYARAVQVLRDSGASVQLVVKRRIVIPAPEAQTLKVTLTKNKKKDDFGIVLGCRIYIKEISNKAAVDKDGTLKEGDVLLRINSNSTDNLTLKEARKLIESAKERLQLVVRRDPPPSVMAPPDLTVKDIRNPEHSDTRPNYSTQNLYVQPPTRSDHQRSLYGPDTPDAKNNLMRSGYNPVVVGMSSGEVPYGLHDQGSPHDDAPPPRPPLPRPEDYYTRHAPKEGQNSPSKGPSLPVPDPRFVSFKKEGSVGIRLTGGNEVGIFVTAVQPGSQAQLQGLIPGDKILKVNDMDMSGVTREEAVLYLMSLQDQIDLIVQTRRHDYDHILNSQKGDLFYIKTHFHYEPNGKSELSFRSGDIFRVVDTLHNGVVGAWQVHRIGRNNQETQKGIIPNKARAEELATAQFNAAKKEQTQSESRSGFFKRRRNSRRSKSLGKDHWEDVVFADSVSKFPAYERVALRHPGFVRPIVLFGPLADIAREKLLKENPDKFASPRIYMRLTMPIPCYGGYPYPSLRELDSSGEKPSGIIRLSAIREIMDRGKHAVLDITPNAVDRLNYAQFYPIVIFLRAESKQNVKELRSGFPKGRMSSKKLFDQSVKLEKLWSHVFTAIISLTQPESWFRKVKEIVEKQQSGPVWMSETKPVEFLSDVYLMPLIPSPSGSEEELHSFFNEDNELDADNFPDLGHEGQNETQDPSFEIVVETISQNMMNGHISVLAEDEKQPDPTEALSDDFLFPMTSRLSYASSPESDLETGPESRTPSKSPHRVPPSLNAYSDSRDSRGRLVKSSSDPSLAAPEENLPNAYGGPPPYTATSPTRLQPPGPKDAFDDRRKSHGGDSKYGFASGGFASTDIYASRPPVTSQSNNNIGSGGGGGSSGGGGGSSSNSGGVTSVPGSPYSSVPPPGYNNRPPQQTNLPLPAHSPHHRRSPHVIPGRGPPHVGYSPPGPGGHLPPPPPYLNGHSNETGPELPPKVDRTSKPGRVRSGQDFGSGKELDYDNNYLNTGRGNSLERQHKSPYEMSPSLGPNAHDDLKSRLHPQSPHEPYRYSRSSSQPPTYRSDDPYRSSDYKPVPPPKSSNYKPVPPPKPKNYKPQPPGSNPITMEGGLSGWDVYDGRKLHDRGNYHTTSNGGLSDDYSGLDSGQGSSLDRKYDTFGRSSYSKAATSGRSGYYLNVPPPWDMVSGGGQHGGGGPGGRDLPNHDHRGSAFELYKKPPDPRGPPGSQPGPPLNADLGNSRRSLADDGKHKVIATARGVYDHKGGTLTSEETGVSIVIPPGAITKGTKQEIYFKVCQDSSLVPPLDQNKGETLLSPLVMCGPHGLQFERPVELRLPHAASVSPNTWSFALKSSDTPTGQPTQWTNMALADAPHSSHIGANCVSVLVDHF